MTKLLHPPVTVGSINMQVFMINLDRSPHRRAFMQAQLDRYMIPFERVPGIEPGADLAGLPHWLKSDFKNTPLPPGKVGCYASHMAIAREIVARDLPYALILEDDVTLDIDIARLANAAALAAPDDWDVLHLSGLYKRAVVALRGIEGHDIVMHTRLPTNTAAYVLSNTGARKRLRPRPRLRPNDLDFFRYAWLDDVSIYGVYPPLAQQRGDFASDIGGDFPGVPISLASRLYGMVWQARRIGLGNMTRGRVMGWTHSLRRKRGGERRVPIIDGRRAA